MTVSSLPHYSPAAVSCGTFTFGNGALSIAIVSSCVEPHAGERGGVDIRRLSGDLSRNHFAVVADIVTVVGGNPLEDIGHVRKLRLVFKEGAIVSDKR